MPPTVSLLQLRPSVDGKFSSLHAAPLPSLLLNNPDFWVLLGGRGEKVRKTELENRVGRKVLASGAKFKRHQ